MRRLLPILLLFEAASRISAMYWKDPEPWKFKNDATPFRCPYEDRVLSSTDICNKVLDCGEWNRHDEDTELCAPEECLRQGLLVTANSITNNSAFLMWSPGVEPSLMGCSLELSGYILTGNSTDHSFQKTLEPTLTEYNVSCLKPWNEYNITLRRFYPNRNHQNIGRPMVLGRASMVALRTHAYTPPAPSEIKVISAWRRSVHLRIADPVPWNGLPLSYHIRWEPRDPRSGVPGNIVVDISSGRPRGQNWIDANVPLEPGVKYTLFVSAENAGENPNVTFRGPEISREAAALPLEPTSLEAFPLSSRELLVSWRASSPAEYFQVHVFGYLRKAWDALPEKGILKIDGSGSESSERSIIVDELTASENFTVRVGACSLGGCSSAETWAITKPTAIPEPVITQVAANSTSSFNVAWSFDDVDTRYYDGFLVRYCPSSSLCSEKYTPLNTLNATNLAADKWFNIEVRARIKHDDGRIELGPAAKAGVATWKEVPLAPGLEIRASDATPNELVLFWTFINSTVDYLQVSKEDAIWTNCTDDVGCNVAVMHGWTPELKTGFITLKNLVPYTLYIVSLKGCNDAGCGEETIADVRTGLAAPSEPTGLMVSSQNIMVTDLVWKRPSVPGGPLDGYIVSWLCPSTTEKRSILVVDPRIGVENPDLPQGYNCSISVSGFNRTPEGHMLIGTAAEISL